MNLVSLLDMTASDIRAIWRLSEAPPAVHAGTVGWSFEGNGIRTRTSFILAFRELGLSYIELPNLLKSNERVVDLAGYLDDFYDMYVIRESNHQRLQDFAVASRRPVINAMSQAGHPCEVLTDAFYIDTRIVRLEDATVGLWGPPTNVLESWHELARVFGIEIYHFCPPEFHAIQENVAFFARPGRAVDVLITDSWPKTFNDTAWSLTPEHMSRLGNPELLPTPPFNIGKELGFDPAGCRSFVGYAQKRLLLDVQRAIIAHLMGSHANPLG